MAKEKHAEPAEAKKEVAKATAPAKAAPADKDKLEVPTEKKPASRQSSHSSERHDAVLSTSVLSQRRPSKYYDARRNNRSSSGRGAFSPQPNFNETQVFSQSSVSMSHTMSHRDFQID